jgi:pimeloyl-ACP methyl ester carboxylesterase
MSEQLCDVGQGIELCYETFGDPADPTALLVMGLGMQMVAWHDDFCLALAQRGLHVVRFDNRDAGRSTHLEGPPPTLLQLLRRSPAPARYTLEDMAEDASRLLRELALGPAHVIGASMGGMIAQLLAIRHPEQVSSLTSIMSNTGNRRVGQPAVSIYPAFLRRTPADSEAFLDHSVAFFRTIGSPMLNLDQRELREIAARSYARDHDGTASGRQLAAIIASPDRTPELRSMRVPTLVIHGSADRLVQPSGGKATARAIPGARLLEIAGMGHDLPRVVWPRMIDAIVENSAREPVEVVVAERSAVRGAPYRGRRRRWRGLRPRAATPPASLRTTPARTEPSAGRLPGSA